ncbi:MAG: CBS domain-containing protein [Desulfobacterales bacterium]|nr:MAG: CBS domain-containing protein [Desulfobacterales bacterium]
MLVKNWMSKPAVTIDADASVAKAVKLLKKHEINMLPVMMDNRLAGIIANADIQRASAAGIDPLKQDDIFELMSQVKVGSVMNPKPITVAPEYTVEETAEILLINRISGLPVVDGRDAVVGVITKSDILQLILTVSGKGKHGIQFALEMENQPDRIREITDVILDYGGRISSLISTQERADRRNQRLYLRIYDIDQPSFLRLTEVIQERAKLLYIINHDLRTRHLF